MHIHHHVTALHSRNDKYLFHDAFPSSGDELKYEYNHYFVKNPAILAVIFILTCKRLIIGCARTMNQ
jgi:hypothetical protein